MYTLQNDILTQIMEKHIRQRKYIDIFRLGVGCIIIFVGGVRGGVGVGLCVDRAALWPPGFYVVVLQASGAWFSWF